MIDSALKHCFRHYKQNYSSPIRKVFYSDAAILVSHINKLKSLEQSDRTKQTVFFKKKFVENLFINKFDETVLEYPEISTLKEVNSLNNNCNVAKELLAGVPLLTEPTKNVNNLKELQLCGFKVSVMQGGFGYQNLEFARMQEAIGSDLSLSKFISENENFGVEIIKRFGNDVQKEIYLSKLATGKCTSCFAHSESNMKNPLQATSLNTKASLSPDGRGYKISGEKNWVYNANCADLIIFSANVETNPTDSSKENLTLFAVDKNMHGITIHEPLDKLGLNGVNICKVTFSDLIVPEKCMLGKIHKGDDIIKQLFCTREINNSIQCLATMKKLINASIDHCLNNKFFNEQKFENDLYKVRLGNLIGRYYAVESMAYLVAGRLDTFEDADVFLEAVILKIFSSETLQYILKNTLEITDGDIYSDSKNNLENIMDDSQMYLGSDYTNNYLRYILCSAGCKHFIQCNKERNIFNKLTSISLKESLGPLLNKDDYTVNFKNHLKGYLHLIFETQSTMLEDMVYRLNHCTGFLYKKYGENIYSRFIQLGLLADLVVDIYATAAILGRASRAYCIAVRNQEVDRSIAECETSRIFVQFIKNVELLKDNSFSENLHQISSTISSKNNYSQNFPIFSTNNVKH